MSAPALRRRPSPRLRSEDSMSRPRTSAVTAATLVVLALVWFGAARLRSGHSDPALVASVRRGTLTATLTASGTLRPVQSITYRSPVAGRDVEIKQLAPEGALVKEG